MEPCRIEEPPLQLTLSEALVVILALCLAVALLGWWSASTRTRRHNRRRQIRAQEGEDAADRLLRAHGFRVLDHQVTARFLMEVDGEEVWVHDRCDRIVEREGAVYVADVKTGRAADPLLPATRRQLLEYLLVHEADGALVVDMEEESIVHVGFPGLLEEP